MISCRSCQKFTQTNRKCEAIRKTGASIDDRGICYSGQVISYPNFSLYFIANETSVNISFISDMGSFIREIIPLLMPFWSNEDRTENVILVAPCGKEVPLHSSFFFLAPSEVICGARGRFTCVQRSAF